MAKNIFLFLLLVSILTTGYTQNVGIGTNAPQQKLHVAGGLRLDTLVYFSNSPGILQSNNVGDVSNLLFSFDNKHVLKADGTWGVAPGAVPTSGIIASRTYNNTELINAGFSLTGELPGISKYTTTSTTFPANSWQPTYVRGIVTNVSAPEFSPSIGETPTALWNGNLMYVVTQDKMYSYEPVADTWAIVNNSEGFNFYLGAKALWTGTEFIYWSGYTGIFGKKYNPVSNTWTSMSTVNAPSARFHYSMIWDGSRVIIWGGTGDGSTALNTGAMYDPVTNVWTTLNTASAPAARMNHTAIWSTATNRMIIWGGSSGSFSGEMNTGALFNPVTNTWTGTTNTATAPSARNLHTAIWSGTEMIIFGGNFSATPLNTGGKYDPVTNTWITTNTSVGARFNHTATWSGSKMYVVGGQSSLSFSDGYVYDPVTNTWTYLGSFNPTDAKSQHAAFFTGNMVVIWGGKNYTSLNPTPTWSNTGYRYFLNSTLSSATTLTSETLYLYMKD